MPFPVVDYSRYIKLGTGIAALLVNLFIYSFSGFMPTITMPLQPVLGLELSEISSLLLLLLLSDWVTINIDFKS